MNYPSLYQILNVLSSADSGTVRFEGHSYKLSEVYGNPDFDDVNLFVYSIVYLSSAEGYLIVVVRY